MKDDEIMTAVRQELTETNKALGIADGLTDNDYKYLGVIKSALQRSPQQNDTTMNTKLTMYTVYKSPKDFPNKYVVRRFENDIPKELIIVADSLEDARKAIPKNLYQMPRQSQDDPVIIETWF